MLWTAGQRRTVREGRERLAELYVGMRDGYVAGNVALGKAKAKGGRSHVPAYAGPEAEGRATEANRGLAQLRRDFPANVTTNLEFAR